MGRQATGKATLVPTERTKGGKTFWVGRGQVPVREADGTVGSRRVERGFDEGVTTARQREAQCARWNQEYQQKFENPRRMISFAAAWTNYIAYLGEQRVPLYEVEILQALGAKQCDEIDDAAIADLVKKKFPKGDAEASTINRHILTPVLSCLRKALKERTPQLTRPKGHGDIKPVEVASPEWFRAVMPELNANLKALVLFLAAHGRRIGEALGRRPHDLDDNTLDLGKTKTGLMTLVVQQDVLDLIHAVPDWKSRKWLFGYGPKSHGAVYRALKKACKRAGVRWISPHKFGRHTSVTRMLQAGFSVAYVAKAHNMTPTMVMYRYGHLELAETTEALHQVGGELVGQVLNGGNVGEGGVRGGVRKEPIPLISQTI